MVYPPNYTLLERRKMKSVKDDISNMRAWRAGDVIFKIEVIRTINFEIFCKVQRNVFDTVIRPVEDQIRKAQRLGFKQ